MIVFYKFSLEVPSKLKMQCKKGHVFLNWFWMVYYTSWYCLLRTGVGGEGGGLLNGKNPLSVAKIIFRQSVKDFL